ncbi:MAG: hypothetical protein ACRELX_09630 [Longimicrobiales bacterium]
MQHELKPYPRFLAVLAPLAALIVWAMPTEVTRDPRSAPSLQCAASLMPDTARIQSEPVTIGYTVPDSIGTVTDVTAQEGSGLVVGTVDGDARTVELRTESASAGRWLLTFAGDSNRVCDGTLNVIGVSPAH